MLRSFASNSRASSRFSTCVSNGSRAWFSTDDSSQGLYDKITFLGAGKMAQAMINPLIKKGYQPESKVCVYDVSNSAMKSIKKDFPTIQTGESISDAIADSDLILLAVKPQNINSAFFEQFKDAREDATLISILAGKPMSAFEASGVKKLVRCMPNTPASIGAGVSTYCCTPNIKAGERDRIKQIMGTFGKAIYVDDEKFVDMSTSISGSGPAYIFMLMEAMIDAGVHMGFSRDVATTLTYHTLLGSTKYAMETGEHPAILRNQVTSPAGTTASAIYELENGKFRVVIKDAIWACYRRSLEIGGHVSAVGPGRQHFPDTKEVIHHHWTGDGEMSTGDSDDEDEHSKTGPKGN